MKIPQHVAIILDGNGRWAKKRMMPRQYGHAKGAQVVEQICEDAWNMGIKYLTVYAFSTENWKRAKEEVSTLMALFQSYLDDYSKRADSENIKVKVLGDITALSQGMQKSIINCIERTKNNTGITFNIALNYGGRDEIVKAVKRISTEVKENKLDIDDINEETFSKFLYTAGQPDPDLLIRTSGEQRLSNYLLWQLAYTEFYFIKKYWPDFSEQDLDEAISKFEARNRNFGGK